MEPPIEPATHGRWTSRVLLTAIVAVLLAYALQVPGPTKMMNDSVSYFMRAHHLLAGDGLATDHPKMKHPVGYSIVLAGMIRLGMDSVGWFIALNVVSLVALLGLMVPLYRRVFGLSDRAIAWCTVLFLLSWTVVKHVPMLYSELLYTALSVLILWLLICAQPKPIAGRVMIFVLAVALAGALILIRTIGIAMLPVLLWYLVQQVGGLSAIRQRITRDTSTGAAFVLLVIVVAGGLGYKIVTYDLDAGSRYVKMMVNAWTQRPIQTTVQVIDHRLLEFGKLILNLPERALKLVLPGASWAVPVYLFGVIGYTLVAAGLWMQRRKLSLIHIYLFAFAALQLPWLSYDARFWLPVMPMLFAVVAEPLGRVSLRWPAPSRWVATAYALCFCAVGVLAMGLNLRSAYAGRDYAAQDLWFPRELSVAYGLANAEDFNAPGRKPIDLDAVRIIRRYDPNTPERLRLTGIPAPLPPATAPDSERERADRSN